jgi:hypothetical protein
VPFIRGRNRFAVLLGIMEDGQKVSIEIFLGWHVIIVRLRAIEDITPHTWFYWTVAYLTDLRE